VIQTSSTWHRGSGCFKSPVLGVISLALCFLGVPGSAVAQEELTLPELEGLYRGALAEYEGAFQVLEVLSSQSDRASLDFSAALAAGDEGAANRAYAETLRIAGLRRQAQRRVEEKVEELRVARERLLDATARSLEAFLAHADTASDPENQRVLTTFVTDTRNRLSELRALEDPPVTLEPLPNINAEPRDGPQDLRAKATILEVTARQYEDQRTYYQRQLQGLRRDQNLLRRTDDFLADFNRFDDPTVPVAPPGARTVPPPGQVQPPSGADSLGISGGPYTLEQRIQALELLLEEIPQLIQTVRVRAETLRRLAGGEWA
jgi:hypothetical protein